MKKLNLDDYLNAPVDASDDRLVPNRFPAYNAPYRIAIIGEAPGADEVREGQPFVGLSGRLLMALMSKAGLTRDTVFLGNVCQRRPPANDISLFPRDGADIQDGLNRLAADLDAFQPNLCVLLGKTSLWAAKGLDAISNWRGSLFTGERTPFLGRKCLAAYHPAACLRQYEWTPLLMFDLKKARREGESALLELPERNLLVDLSVDEIVRRLDDIRANQTKVSIDIEGGVWGMSCIGVATSPYEAFIVPFENMDGSSYNSVDDEIRLWRALAPVLADPEVPKILQNSLYDRFVLQYTYDIVVRGVSDDTMLKHWELYCELEKGLGFLCSLYTNEPYYKSDRKSDDRATFFRYCCRDAAVTYEISERLDKVLSPQQRAHYDFNMALLNPILFMEGRGIRYDSAKADERKRAIDKYVAALQYDLDEIAGFGVKPPLTKGDLLSTMRGIMCHKRDQTRPKKAFENDYAYLYQRLTSDAVLDKTFLGEFNIACGLSLNIKSPKFKQYIYETRKLPLHLDPKTHQPTVDYEALLKIWKKTNDESTRLALEIGMLRTRSQMLAISSDGDGRVRCGYNVVGTETGRLTCYTSPTGSGYNLQTIPKENTLKPLDHPLRRGMRDLFIADPGYYLFECDLAGADGWTVAAHLARLGDPTMLLDYTFGLKPAKILCYMLRHGAASLFNKERNEIKVLTAEVTKESWDYFACKIGQHMSSYMGGARKLSDVILMESEGRVVMSERECKELQNLFYVRYKLRHWWDATARALSKTPVITSASGHSRRFFGRSTEILGQALAHEPQANTTYACNLAAGKLWSDQDNRRPVAGRDTVGGTEGQLNEVVQLRIQPLHQVHDALVGQFRIEDTAWAVDRIKSYFANPLIIAGQEITIPFEGAYGTDWALEDGHGKVGSI